MPFIVANSQRSQRHAPFQSPPVYTERPSTFGVSTSPQDYLHEIQSARGTNEIDEVPALVTEDELSDRSSTLTPTPHNNSVRAETPAQEFMNYCHTVEHLFAPIVDALLNSIPPCRGLERGFPCPLIPATGGFRVDHINFWAPIRHFYWLRQMADEEENAVDYELIETRLKYDWLLYKRGWEVNLDDILN